jgi:glycosyltransferase involved in cell wall biosynthesis
MRRLIFVTQRIDPEHPNLAAATAKVRALAGLVDEVVVIALRAVPGVLPANCTVHEIGAARRTGRGAAYLGALLRSLRPRPIGLIAHMSPIYAVLAAPFLRPLGVPVVLWFTHWRRSRVLELAERLSTRVVTVAPESFPLPSSKVVPIGHGIDLAELPCRDRSETPPPFRVLALGRTSPAKGLLVVADAVGRVRERGLDAVLEIRGPSETEEECEHKRRLESLAGESVRVEPPLPRTRLAEAFAGADVLVNNAAEGSLDKVVFEACASCVPVLASNTGFRSLLGDELVFARDDAGDLAARLARLAAAPPGERQELGRRLRARVEAEHSAQSWAARVLEVLGAT